MNEDNRVLMRFIHFILYGMLLVTNGYQPIVVSHNTITGMERHVPIVTAQQRIALSTYRGMLRANVNFQTDPESQTLLTCLRGQEADSKLLARGADVSMQLFTSQYGSEKDSSVQILQIMGLYKSSFQELARLYDALLQEALTGLSLTPADAKKVNRVWSDVDYLDHKFPSARSFKYLGVDCQKTSI